MLSAYALFGILTVSCLMSVAILGSLTRTDVPGLPRWCVGYGLLALASFWIVVVGAQPGNVTITGASLAMLVGVLLIVQGTRQIFGIRPVVRMESAACAGVWAALIYYTWISPDMGVRGALLSMALAYSRMVVGTLALRHAGDKGRRYACLLIAVAAWIGALIYLAHAVAIALGSGPPTSFLQLSPWKIVLLGVAIVTLPCLSVGMVMLAHDRVLQKMERLATIDTLTGALTRGTFLARADALLANALQRDVPLSIAILDIDHFKAVNDGFGHAVGDRLLAQVAATVSNRLRPGDFFGRLGGEEFAIAFANAGRDDAVMRTNALRQAIAQASTDGVSCTLSAGVGSVVPGDTLASAMVRVDAALYLAKAAGRNCVVTTSELEDSEVFSPLALR